MRCNRTKRHLTAFLDGELDEKLRAGIEEHLSSCATCRSERKALERVRSAMEQMQLPELEPCVSADAILDRARSENRDSGKWEREGRGRSLLGGISVVGLRPAIAVAMGLGVVAMVWLVPFLRSIPLPTDQEVFMVERMELFENLDLIQDLSLLERLGVEQGQDGELS
jgi:anti-sigma factor RsiW